MPTLCDFQVMKLEGEEQNASDYAGNLCLLARFAPIVRPRAPIITGRIDAALKNS